MVRPASPSLLDGIRVLDLSRVLAGPWATQLLADFGAEVVKVERPGAGDDTRAWGPPWVGGSDGEAGEPGQPGQPGQPGESAYYLSTNRGKRSVTIDFSRPEGQRLVHTLAKDADVLVENFRVGQLARYGLDAATLRAANPRLVYCSITGFGQTGPARDRAGYDAMIQALGGLMSITGEAAGPPQKVGVAVADLMCGMYAASGILAAVLKARETGRGETIDLALFDSQLAWLANQAMNYLVSGNTPQRRGSAHPNIVPYQPFACSDGYLMLAIGNDRQFRRWCDLAGASELADDGRFLTNRDRVAHRDALIALMEPIIAARGRSDWLTACSAAGVPCGPINDIGQAFEEPQAEARGMRISLPHPDDPSLPQVANPLRFSDHPVRYDRPPPRLGQHTTEVLAELGLDEAAIEALRTRGVV